MLSAGAQVHVTWHDHLKLVARIGTVYIAHYMTYLPRQRSAMQSLEADGLCMRRADDFVHG